MGYLRAVWASVPTRCASTVAPVLRVTQGTPVTVRTHLSGDGIVGEVKDSLVLQLLLDIIIYNCKLSSQLF